MTDTPKRNRRWFQFRLRALLIFVALFCVAGGWFGNQVRIVHVRDAMAAAPGVDSLVATDLRDNIVVLAPNRSALVPHEIAERLPRVRRWLGDRYYLGVSVAPSASDEDIADYKRVFPEATIIRRPPGGILELWRRVTQPSTVDPPLRS
jgi:hypothetical protein